MCMIYHSTYMAELSDVYDTSQHIHGRVVRCVGHCSAPLAMNGIAGPTEFIISIVNSVKMVNMP